MMRASRPSILFGLCSSRGNLSSPVSSRMEFSRGSFHPSWASRRPLQRGRHGAGGHLPARCDLTGTRAPNNLRALTILMAARMALALLCIAVLSRGGSLQEAQMPAEMRGWLQIGRKLQQEGQVHDAARAMRAVVRVARGACRERSCKGGTAGHEDDLGLSLIHI